MSSVFCLLNWANMWQDSEMLNRYLYDRVETQQSNAVGSMEQSL